MKNILKKATLAFGIATSTVGAANAQNATEQAVIDKAYANIIEIAQDPDMQRYVRNGYNLSSDPDIKRYLYAMDSARNDVYSDNITEKMQMSFCLAANTVGYMDYLLPQVTSRETIIKMLAIRDLANNTTNTMNNLVFAGQGNSRHCPQFYSAHGVPIAGNLP